MNDTIYSKDHKQLIEKLKKVRVEIGLDQSEVAKQIGKTQSYVSKVESGQRRIDIIQLKEFAKLYKKDIHYFIN